MRKLVLTLGVAFGALAGSVHADDLDDAYEKGRAVGYEEGYNAARAEFVASGAVTTASQDRIVIPGSRFSTIIEAIAKNGGQDVQVSPGDSVAIIPKESLPEFTRRLGAEFLTDSDIQLNNGAQIR